MHGGQEFQAIGRLEAFHQFGHVLEADAADFVLIKEIPGFIDRAGHEGERFVGRVAAVGLTCNQMAFDCAQHMAQVLGIRPVGRLDVPEPQRLTGFLHEVHQLVDFQ